MTAIFPPQRKDADGNYAKHHGINVPLIFPSFEAAQSEARNGGTVIVRTEHPSELKGVSGVNHSHVLSPDDHFGKDFIDTFCDSDEATFVAASKAWHEKWFHVEGYCEQRGISIQDYVSDLDYSYWEHVTGLNIFVVGDPVLPNRFRIFATWPDTWTYTVFDGDEYVSGYESEELKIQIDSIIKMYRRVQEVFGAQSWVVEMQLHASGELFFLQRSNGRPMQSVDWSFEVESDPHLVLGCGYGEVLGSTSQEGVEVDVLLERSTRYNKLTKDKPSALLCSHITNVVIEQDVVSNSAAYIRVKKYLSHGPGGHSSVIPMTKSPLHLFAPNFVDQLPETLRQAIEVLEDSKRVAAGMPSYLKTESRIQPAEMARDFDTNPDHMVRLRLNIRSDGREARLTLLDMA
jgi:hypothetical protein